MARQAARRPTATTRTLAGRTAQTIRIRLTTTRSPTSPATRPASPRAPICRTSRTSSAAAQRPAALGQLRQAGWRRERAPWLRERAQGQQPPAPADPGRDERPQAGNTLILVTYDEFGGSWDHVPPPSASNNVAAHDQWGPGTRVPAILIGRSLTKSGVDDTYYDTLSIMRTIEAQWNWATCRATSRRSREQPRKCHSCRAP